MKSLNPSCKFIGLLLPTLLLALLHQPILNLSVFALCLLAMLCSRVNLKHLSLAMLPILLAAAGMFMTGYRFQAGGGAPVNAETLNITQSPLWNGLTLSSRVLAFAGLGFLFVLTTDRIALVRSLHLQLRLPAVFAYGLLAAWGMVPNMLDEYRRTRRAFALRGIRVLPFSPALLGPMLVKSVRWSQALSIAMESKGFSGGAPRTCSDPMPLRKRDVAFPIITCTIAVLACIYCVTLRLTF